MRPFLQRSRGLGHLGCVQPGPSLGIALQLNMKSAKLVQGLLGNTELPWTESPSHVEGEPGIRWIHVVTIKEFQDPWPGGTKELVLPRNLGLSDQGFWVLWWERGGLVTALDYPPTRHCCFLWPLLEGRPQELLGNLERGLRAIRQPVDWVKRFPLSNLLASALESQSEEWFRDACRWLESVPCTLRVRQALERVRLEGQSEFLKNSAATLLEKIPKSRKMPRSRFADW